MTPEEPIVPPIRAALTELVADQSQPTTTREWYLFFQQMQGSMVGLIRGGGQTPWLQNIDGAQYALGNVSAIGVNSDPAVTPRVSTTIQPASVQWRHNSDLRWALNMETDETGVDNAGSNLDLYRYADDGTQTLEFVIDRNSGFFGVNAELKAVGLIAEQALYLAPHDTSASLTAPDPTFGALAYKGGSEYFYYNADTTSWMVIDFAVSSGAPGGVDQSVQYKSGTGLAGDGNFTWDSVNQTLLVIAKPPDAGPPVGPPNLGLKVQDGYIESTAGFYSPSTADNAVKVPNGGANFGLGVAAGQALYLAAHGASTELNIPSGGYGGLAYKGGSEYWYFNASTGGWSSFDFATAGSGTTAVPGGVDQSIQYRKEVSGVPVFAGDGFLKWDWPNQCLIVQAHTATPPDPPESSPGIHVVGGYIDADLGFNSLGTTYNVFQALTGGAVVAGIGITSSPTKGVYISMPPLNGTPPLTFPGPLTGIPFPDDRVILWNSATNGTPPANVNTTYSLCCNAGIRSSASFISANAGTAAFQSDSGGATLGMAAYLKGHATGNVAGGLNDAPASYGGLAYKSGSSYWFWDGTLTPPVTGTPAGWKTFNFATSVPAGDDQSVQYKVGSAFAGDGNLTWDWPNQTLIIQGKVPTPPDTTPGVGIHVVNGYIDSSLGYTTGNPSYQSIQSPTGGVYCAGLGIVTSSGKGGYIDIPPQTGTFPVPLTNASFAADHILIWSSNGNGTTTPVTAYTLCCNSGIRAAASFISGETGVAAFQTDSGGATLGMAVYLKGHATGNVAGGLNNAPASYGGLSYKSGSVYWFWDGTLTPPVTGTPAGWKTVDLATAGSPAGNTQDVQFNNSGAFGGSDNFTWNDTTRLLTIKSSAPGVAGISVEKGFVQTDGGLLVNVSTNYNSIQTPGGIVALGRIGVFPAFTPDLGSGLTGVTGLFVTQDKTNNLLVDCYDAANDPARVPGFIGRRAFYTGGPPGSGTFQNLPSGLTLMSIGGRGATTSGFISAASASITFVTSEAWSPSAFGTDIQLNVTPNFQNTRYAKAWLRQSGMLQVRGIVYNENSLTAYPTQQLATQAIGLLLDNGNLRLADNNGGAALMMTSTAASTNLPVPGSTAGGIAHQSGSTFWFYNGSGWSTVNFATTGGGVSNVNGFAGAVSIAPGTGVTIVNSANTVTVSIGQAVGTGANPTFAGLTSSGPIQCSGAGIVFQTTSPFNIQMDNTGVVSCQQLNIAGQKCVGSDRIWVQTVQTNNHVYGGDFGIIGGGVTGFGNHTGYTAASGATVTLVINGVTTNVKIIGGIICN